VNLSIKGVPEEIVERLRTRALRHHRSLQGELMAIIEEAVNEPSKLTPMQVFAAVQRLGIGTPSEAVAMIREDRDALKR
jgi:plasmid stability protein